MKCLACRNKENLKSICKKQYNFSIYPFSKSFVCSKCESKYDVLFLLATSRKIRYLISKRKTVIPA